MNDRPGNRTTSGVWSRAQVVQGTPSGSSGPYPRARAALCHVSIYALVVNLYHGSWRIYSTYMQWIIFVLHLTISRKLKHRAVLLDPYIVSLWSFVYFTCFQQNTRLVGEISGHLRSQKSIAWTQSFRLQEYWLSTYLSWFSVIGPWQDWSHYGRYGSIWRVKSRDCGNSPSPATFDSNLHPWWSSFMEIWQWFSMLYKIGLSMF